MKKKKLPPLLPPMETPSIWACAISDLPSVLSYHFTLANKTAFLSNTDAKKVYVVQPKFGGY